MTAVENPNYMLAAIRSMAKRPFRVSLGGLNPTAQEQHAPIIGAKKNTSESATAKIIIPSEDMLAPILLMTEVWLFLRQDIPGKPQ